MPGRVQTIFCPSQETRICWHQRMGHVPLTLNAMSFLKQQHTLDKQWQNYMPLLCGAMMQRAMGNR